MSYASAPVLTLPQTEQALLAYYIDGRLAGKAWDRMMRFFDADDTALEQRAALAQFVADAATEFGAAGVDVPRLHEARSLLGSVHPA